MMSNPFREKNLEATLMLAEAGFRVFPARSIYNINSGHWNKPPYISDWQSRATNDLRSIKHWWQQYPDAIPAIVCDNFVVVDADRHEGGADGVAALAKLASQHGDWRDHPKVVTPNGGEHHHFAQSNPPLGNRTGQLPPGIDVRGIGGYVIGPGAVLPNGKEWRLDTEYSTVPPLPRWLERLIGTDKEVPTQLRSPVTARNRRFTATREERYAEAALEACANEVATASKGTRNTTLNNVAYRLGRMVTRGWIDRNKVETCLLYAAFQLKNEDGLAAVMATIKSGIDAGCRKPHPDITDREGGEK